MTKGKDGAVYQAFANSLEDVRVAIFRKDALRSLLFIILATVPVFLFGYGKLKAQIAFPILAALVVLDLFPIDKRYLNNKNFIPKRQFETPFTASVADNAILSDNSLDFRVLNLTKDVFNDASTSYFHKSVGGYHGAKLRRYQDVINQYLSHEIKQFGSIFKNANTEADLALGLRQQKVLNMLNTKYIIYDANNQPLLNPCTFGNAWTVNSIRWVATPDEEIDAIESTDLMHTAILSKEFEQQLANHNLSDSISAQITLTDYKPNRLTYHFKGVSAGSMATDYLVLFSEIWSNMGWKMYLDGQEHPLLRANYLLRASLIPSGEHEIVMEYAPKIWKVGNNIQLASSTLLILGLIAAIFITIKKQKKQEA